MLVPSGWSEDLQGLGPALQISGEYQGCEPAGVVDVGVGQEDGVYPGEVYTCPSDLLERPTAGVDE